MNFKYYHYNLGKARFESGEMHASLHEISIDKNILNSDSEYINQLINYEMERDKLVRYYFDRT